MKIFGNFTLDFVQADDYEKIKNIFNGKSIDCVVFTINEKEYRTLLFEECCVKKCVALGNCCINNNFYLKLHPDVEPFASYYGNLHKDKRFLDGTDLHIFDDTKVVQLNAWFEEFLITKKEMYDSFHNNLSPQIVMKVLTQIKSIFPFFLALNHKNAWKCNGKPCDNRHKISFVEAPFSIKYCDNSTFFIHKTFNPANVTAYIGCNKPYSLQLDDLKHSFILVEKTGERSKEHTPFMNHAAKHKGFAPHLKKAIWNILHTIAIEIIKSNQWINNSISTTLTGKYNLPEIGSLNRIIYKRLGELQDHIEYISGLFKLVQRCNFEDVFQSTGKTYIGFKDSFCATEHVYRHYDEIRKLVIEDSTIPLFFGPLDSYPERFPDTMTDTDEIEKCLCLYFYDVPVLHAANKLSSRISVEIRGGNITTIKENI